MARTNKTKYALIGMLSKRPMSGYDIKRIFAKIGEFYWAESNAQIYPMLKKLEGEGLVTSQLDDSGGKREKRIYAITAAGKETLLHWLHGPIEHCVYREELFLKLSLAQHVDKTEAMQWINDYRVETEAKQVVLKRIIKHIEVEHDGLPDKPFLHMTYDYYQHIFKARLAWCDETLKKLQKLLVDDQTQH